MVSGTEEASMEFEHEAGQALSANPLLSRPWLAMVMKEVPSAAELETFREQKP